MIIDYNDKIQYAEDFEDGIALISYEQKVSFLNKKGEILSPFKFFYCNSKKGGFYQGKMLVSDGKQCYVINKNLRSVSKKFDYIRLSRF